MTVQGKFTIIGGPKKTTMRIKWFNHQVSKDKDDYLKREPILSNFVEISTDHGFRDEITVHSNFISQKPSFFHNIFF